MVQGGTPGYTYLWSNGQTAATATGLPAGSFTVTVTDANGCTILAIVTLSNPPLLRLSLTAFSAASCNGGGNGSATVTATGGTPAYTYLWSNGQLGATATGLGAGFYQVTVTDANGCTAATQVTIAQPTELLASIIQTSPVRCRGEANGTALATATGGTPGYTFTWPGGFTGALHTALAAGTYVVTVTDLNGCTATATATITQPSALLTVIETSHANVGCYGEASGLIDVTASGGTAPYAYQWSVPAPDVEDPGGLPAGNYTVTVTDLRGCTATTSVTIAQPATLLTAMTTKLNDALCSGAGTGSARVDAQGGTPGYTYFWSNGQTTQLATGLSAGAYLVTVTDVRGCTTVSAVVIGNPANLTAIITNQSNAGCNGGASGTATVTPSGGTAPYSYLWSAGGQTTQTASGLAAGSHTVTVTDVNGCTVLASVFIGQPTLVVASVVTTAPVSCAGATNGSATVSATGGTPVYTFTWPGGITGATRTGLAAGNYVVTVTDANGCTGTLTVSIGNDGTLTIPPLTAIGPLCPGETWPSTPFTTTPYDPNIVYSWTGGTAAGLPDGSSTGFNAHLPAFTAGGTEGSYTVTVTASLQGCVAQRTFTITILDDVAPAFLQCPGPLIMVNNDPNTCSAKVNWTTPLAADDCGGAVSTVQTAGLVSGSAFPVGSHQINYVANDGHGNTSTCHFAVIVLDSEWPVIHCPTQFLLADAGADCTFTQTAAAWDATATDNCDVVALRHDYAGAGSAVTLAGANFPLGQTAVTWTATDPAGQAVSCSFTVVVGDHTAPTVADNPGCPANITVNNDEHVCGAVVTYVAPLFQDNCAGLALPGTLTSGLPSGQVFPVGATPVHYVYTDAAGNGPATCSFQVVVNDTEFPEITCPADVTVETDGTVFGGPVQLIGWGPCGVTLGYAMPVGTDNCPGAETHLLSGAGAGANYYLYNGSYEHHWRVTDAAGHTASCAFTILVEDPVAPTLICPANTTVAADAGECDAHVTYALPLPDDNCPGYTISQLQGPGSGAEFALGTTAVRFEVVDFAGNTVDCSFTVTVEDQQAPVIACPANQLLPTSGGVAGDCLGLVPDLVGQLLATDNCTPAAGLVLTQSPLAGAPFGGAPGAEQLVTFTVSDAAGNTRSCQTRLTLRDDEAPVINCSPATRTVNADPGACSYQVAGGEFDPVMTDNCLAALTQNFAPAPHPATLAGARFPLGTTVVNFTATDAFGNTASCSLTIQVVDNQAPVFVNCPANITVSNDIAKCGRHVTFAAPIVADNCGAPVVQTGGLASGALFPVGATTVTFGATDAAGLAATCSFTVTVMDMEAPRAVCQDITLDLNAAGLATLTAANLNGGSSDNCTAAGNLVLAASQTAFDCGEVGHNYVTLTVTDQAGNASVCVATVLLRDVTPPVLTCPPNATVSGCEAAVPELAALASASDACGVAGITQSPTAGLEFGLVNGNALSVLITATDHYGNVTTCSVAVAVDDATSPQFINCPTSMIMVGNDVDQCSGKLNWPAPLATDDCQLTNMVQTGGPVSGTAVPISCPPAPATVTYQAIDDAGNVSTCSFQVVVMDTQKPAFDADVVMPADVTVACQSIPPAYVLTPADVHDNCTPANQLLVHYTQVSTQVSNPSACGHYQYTLTRTWRVTDCAGNQLVHTQVITVQDLQVPTAVCQNVTVTLDAFGQATILPAALNGGSTDLCAPPSVLAFSASQTVFTCADLGANTVVLTVTDPCGNSSTCLAVVTVLQGSGLCDPVYDVAGSDPCVCLNNATTLYNGQFSERVQLLALAGQTWRVVTSTGFYLSGSPAPPAAPVPVPPNTLMSNGLSDNVDNDGDGLSDEADEAVYYTYRAIHVEGVGFTATFANAQGQEITISNKCYYPTPYFTNLYDPFCLNTPPFHIAVGEYYGAMGTVTQVLINGVPGDEFDAGTLGEGSYTIKVTFDAGTATANLVVDGVLIGATEEEAQADPGCQQMISQTVQVVGTPSSLVCNDLVYVSLGADCFEAIGADDVLEGSYYCYDDYTVQVDKTLPYGNGPWEPAEFDADDIGHTYQYRVVHATGGNICWGNIKIEDKLAPALTCPTDLTVECSASTELSNTGNIAVVDCAPTTAAYTDEFTDFGQCASPRARIVRTWLVQDASNNQSVCSQTITITPFDLADVLFPPDVTLNCEGAYNNPGYTDPVNTGLPSIGGFPIGAGGLCTSSITHVDEVYSICPGSFEILRTWKVRNTCLPVGPDNPVTHVQVIQLPDAGGPQFVCPPAVTVSTDPFTCCATAALPDMIVSEGCSTISGLEAKVTGVDPNNGNIITFTVGGYLSDFPGNNIWIPDTLAIFPYTQCLPLGDYTVRYTATDGCSNVSTCQFVLTIADLVAPAVACQQVTTVSLGADGMALVNASSFDSGTTDNCSPVEFKVRRMNANDCQTDTVFHDQVKFCCSDIGDTILVVFRAYDVDVPSGDVALDAYEGHYNDCMVQAIVDDKLKPTCDAPANVSVSCENFDPSLWVYGFATAIDNCCIDTITAQNNYSLFDTVCNRGTITRTFRAFDCGGQSSQCTQRIFVNYEQDYYVRFPNDVIVTVCDGTGNYGEPTFYGENCELLGVSFEDEIFTVVPDACFKIERTWKIINWCTYDPNLPCTYVPNPNPNAITNHASNLPGPIVSPLGTPAPWAPTLVKISPDDPTQTNYSIFYDANANCYTYKQIIKIIDTQAPTPACPDSTVTFCDVTVNNAQLWNETYWWDNVVSTHDLCEGPADLQLTATDACSGANIQIEYLLFLDLDGNGSMETVVSSTNLPGVNNVQFGNATNPNFGGGTPQAFDQRGLPILQQYRFAIDRVKNGDTTLTAYVRWDTPGQQASSTNTTLDGVAPELPYGTHKIKWIISDGCGNQTVCEYTFEVKDCKPPTVVCINGLAVNIMPTDMITLWATDFLQYAEDNCTPPTPYTAGPDQLVYAIRKSGQGTGFPVDANGDPITNVTFTCDELGTQTVELWARDLAGNAAYCETYVIVQDPLGNCGGDQLTVAGTVKTEVLAGNQGVEETDVELEGTPPNGLPPVSLFGLSDQTGLYAFGNALPLASNYTVTPVKDDNPMNGVSTFDLVLMSKHILGSEPLNSPYKIIAADVNKSNSVTTFDIVELRKLILGIYVELPNNTSWRFLDKAFPFADALNPFASVPFAENISLADMQNDEITEDFVGVKIGDLNGSVIANAMQQAEERTAGTLLLDVSLTPSPSPNGEGSGSDRQIKAGEVFEVTFKANQPLQGFQFTLNLNGLEVADIIEQGKVTAGNFGVFPDALTASIDGAETFTVKFRATKAGKLRDMLQLSSRITRAEAYSAGNDRLDVALRFSGQTIAGVGFELYQNQPNPWIGKTQVGFHLPEATTATLTVYDETGRVLFTHSGDYAKGYNAITLERAVLNTTGMLYYRLETATHAAIKSMFRSH